jgi:G3E family GTPase
VTGAPAPIPLTLVTGPTGAGKTRLINAALALHSFAHALAISNDAGATVLDRSPPGDFGDLAASACLCCAGAGAFTGMLERLLRALDNKRLPPFDRLIVETSGIADPAAMAGELIAHPYVSKRFRLTGILLCAGPVTSTAMDSQRAAAAAIVPAVPPPAELAALFALPFAPASLPLPARRALYRLPPRR